MDNSFTLCRGEAYSKYTHVNLSCVRSPFLVMRSLFAELIPCYAKYICEININLQFAILFLAMQIMRLFTICHAKSMSIFNLQFVMQSRLPCKVEL